MIKIMQENWIRWSFALLLVFGTTSLTVMADEAEATAETAPAAKAHDDHGHDDHSHDDHGHDDHGGHGDHDATDLSHANASPQLSDPGSIATDMAIYTLIVFLLMVIILRVAAWTPIKKAL